MKIYIVIISICIAVCSFSQSKTHYLSNISSEEDYSLLKGKPNTSKFGDVDALKVLYDLQTDHIYFINSNLYDLHVHFCRQYLKYPNNGWRFNYENYTTTNNRKFLMGTINRFYKNDLFTLEFSVADNIESNQIQFFHSRIMEHFQLSDELKLFINTNNMKNKRDEFLGVLPFIEADEIYSGQHFQSLNQKKSFGNLRFIHVDSIENSKIETKDIIVINGTPNELPPVAGVVTTDFQTPLSHITILCQNRGTPVMALKKAWDDSVLRQLENKAICFEVLDESYLISESTKERVDSFWMNKSKSFKNIELFLDTTVRSIVNFDASKANLISFVGGKASNFAELSYLIDEKGLDFKTPEGAFAIPFYYYKKHIKNHDIDEIINEFLELRESLDDESTRNYLEAIQSKIIESKVDPDLISAVEKKVSENTYQHIRFRSSTNAEDLKGFNGAGLYDSKTGIYGDSIKSFERAIAKVWASLWNYNAFMERDYFGIDQRTIAMGVLCHRSFPDEKANGVVITKNLYRPNYRGFVINAQYGETSVVNPPNNVTCEQIICYSDKNDSFFGKNKIAEYLSYSNILPDTQGQVLTTEEITKITSGIAILKKEFYRRKNIDEKVTPYYEYGLDLEFKIYGEERDIYLKQIRPFDN